MPGSATTREWVWNRGGVGIEGDHLQWFESVGASSSIPGHYTLQGFADYLERGPAVVGVPVEVRDGVRRAITLLVARTAAQVPLVPRKVRIGIRRHGVAWARVSAALGAVGLLAPIAMAVAGLVTARPGHPSPTLAWMPVILWFSTATALSSLVLAVLVWRPRGPGSDLAQAVWIVISVILGQVAVFLFYIASGPGL